MHFFIYSLLTNLPFVIIIEKKREKFMHKVETILFGIATILFGIASIIIAGYTGWGLFELFGVAFPILGIITSFIGLFDGEKIKSNKEE